jgi:hypothetical protein
MDETKWRIGENENSRREVMTGSLRRWRAPRVLLLGLGLLAGTALTGCQVETGGQTLPSPYYMTDDVQYFPPGPEFKLAREAAAQKAYNADQAIQTAQAPRH